MIRIISKRGRGWPAVGAGSGAPCSRTHKQRTHAAALIENKEDPMHLVITAAILAAIGFGVPAWAYEEIAVTDGGSVSGTLFLEGQVPGPKGYNLITLPDQVYCGRISDGQGW